jgi:actin-related protein 8
VNIGAEMTTVTCVEEGLVLPESRYVHFHHVYLSTKPIPIKNLSLSRITLSFGGDDITEILLQLLLRIHFPYKEIDLNQRYDWSTIESLKENIAVLGEVRGRVLKRVVCDR